MADQKVWIGIAIGVFLAGIGLGYVAFATAQSSWMGFWSPQMMNNMMMQNPQVAIQWNQQMMNTQMGRQQMMSSMMQNPQFMSEMMNTTQFQSQIVNEMGQNHSFMQNMIMRMMDDPQIRTQMIGHLLENEEFMQQMQQVLGNQTNSPYGQVPP